MNRPADLVPQRAIGSLRAGAVGFGCATISVRAEPDEESGLRAMRAALEAGVTLFDTADVYNPPGKGAGHSERLLRRALSGRGAMPEGVVVATKGGQRWSPEGRILLDGSPAGLRRACEASLERLGLDCIPLYFLHTTDPAVPFADSVGALGELRAAGLVREVGISNVDLAQLEVARSIVPVAAVENRYSPFERESDGLVDRCAELGIAFLPWGSLKGVSEKLATGIGGRLAAVAAERGASPQQVVVAWLLARSPTVIPIPGSRRPETILDSVAGAALELSDRELSLLSGPAGAVPGSGN